VFEEDGRVQGRVVDATLEELSPGGVVIKAAYSSVNYHFVVYAIDADLGLKPGLNRAELLAAIDGHVIGRGEIVAIYERKPL
jgi:hypothetical protein